VARLTPINFALAPIPSNSGAYRGLSGIGMAAVQNLVNPRLLLGISLQEFHEPLVRVLGIHGILHFELRVRSLRTAIIAHVPWVKQGLRAAVALSHFQVREYRRQLAASNGASGQNRTPG